MHLIDQLRAVADKLPPSHVPSLNELAGIVGAVIAHAEHGDSLFSAAEQGAEAVAKLFAPVAADAVEALVPGSAPVVQAAEHVITDVTDHAALEAQVSADQQTIAELRAQLQEAQLAAAQAGRTQLSVQPGDTPGTLS